MRSDNEKAAGNTLCIGKGFEEVWAHFCPSKPYSLLFTDGIPKSRTGRGCFDSPSPCEPSPATTEVGLRSPFWNPPEVGAVFNIAGSYFCKDKFGAKNGGTPPPNAFRQNGRSVLPFVYFRQTQCKEIVKVNLLTNLKRKKGRKDKKTQQKR